MCPQPMGALAPEEDEFEAIIELEDKDVIQTLREAWEEDLVTPGEFDVY